MALLHVLVYAARPAKQERKDICAHQRETTEAISDSLHLFPFSK